MFLIDLHQSSTIRSTCYKSKKTLNQWIYIYGLYFELNRSLYNPDRKCFLYLLCWSHQVIFSGICASHWAATFWLSSRDSSLPGCSPENLCPIYMNTHTPSNRKTNTINCMFLECVGEIFYMHVRSACPSSWQVCVKVTHSTVPVEQHVDKHTTHSTESVLICKWLTRGARRWEDLLTTHFGNEPAKGDREEDGEKWELKQERKRVKEEEGEEENIKQGFKVCCITCHVIQDQSAAL